MCSSQPQSRDCCLVIFDALNDLCSIRVFSIKAIQCFTKLFFFCQSVSTYPLLKFLVLSLKTAVALIFQPLPLSRGMWEFLCLEPTRNRMQQSKAFCKGDARTVTLVAIQDPRILTMSLGKFIALTRLALSRAQPTCRRNLVHSRVLNVQDCHLFHVLYYRENEATIQNYKVAPQ